jgi:hypothetical protein
MVFMPAIVARTPPFVAAKALNAAFDPTAARGRIAPTLGGRHAANAAFSTEPGLVQ